MKITSKMIMNWKPCDDYNSDDVDRIIGEYKTPIEILDLDISVSDKLWVLFHPEIIPTIDIAELACQFAESVIHIYENRYPNDYRIRESIKTIRIWLQNNEPKSADAVAHAHAHAYAAADAANAAYDAYDAAYDAAYADAAESKKEEKKQLNIVRKYLTRKY